MRFLLATGLFFGMYSISYGATVYMDPPMAELFRGDAVTVAIRLDTDESLEECVNAVDLVISYPENIVPVDVSVGSSIVSLWIENPTINKSDRTITMAGGIPNGYCGRVAGDPRLTNIIAEMIFRAPGLTVGGGDTSNQAAIQFLSETGVYLNDGLGTRITPTLYGSTLTLLDTVGSNIEDQWRLAVQADTVPPEEFTIIFDPNAKSPNGKYYISFNTSDKQTGISHYEVIEEPIDQMSLFGFGAATAPWQRAQSPYILRDQSLNSAIRVRAIDKAGNEYIASYLPEESLREVPYHTYLVPGMIVSAAIIFGILVFVMWRWYKSRKRNAATETEEIIE